MKSQKEAYYHIYNRGVDKRIIYTNDRDYRKFIDGMHKYSAASGAGKATTRPVDVICFCLMPNHFHMVVRVKEEDGMTDFMRRLSTGYTMYFNKKYGRSGVLFESNYKCQLIESDSYLLQVTRYVHLNPLSIASPGWKETGLKDKNRAMEAVKSYEWSSLRAYTADGKSMGFVECSLPLEILGGKEKYAEYMEDW